MSGFFGFGGGGGGTGLAGFGAFATFGGSTAFTGSTFGVAFATFFGATFGVAFATFFGATFLGVAFTTFFPTGFLVAVGFGRAFATALVGAARFAAGLRAAARDDALTADRFWVGFLDAEFRAGGFFADGLFEAAFDLAAALTLAFGFATGLGAALRTGFRDVARATIPPRFDPARPGGAGRIAPALGPHNDQRYARFRRSEFSYDGAP